MTRVLHWHTCIDKATVKQPVCFTVCSVCFCVAVQHVGFVEDLVHIWFLCNQVIFLLMYCKVLN